MPRVKPLIRPSSEETKLRSQIGSIMGALQITQAELAKMAGMDPSTFGRRMKTIGDLKFSEYWKITTAAKKRGWTSETKTEWPA